VLSCAPVRAQGDDLDDSDLIYTGVPGQATAAAGTSSETVRAEGGSRPAGSNAGQTSGDARQARQALGSEVDGRLLREPRRSQWRVADETAGRLQALLVGTDKADSGRNEILTCLDQLEAAIRQAGREEGAPERAEQLLRTAADLRAELAGMFANSTQGYSSFNPVQWWRQSQRSNHLAAARGRLAALTQIVAGYAAQAETVAPSPVPAPPVEAAPETLPPSPPVDEPGPGQETGPTASSPPEEPAVRPYAGGRAISPSLSVWFTAPPSTGGIDDALVALLATARQNVAAHIYQLSDPKIATALADAARRLGPAKVRLVTEYDYLHYRQVHSSGKDPGSAAAENTGSKGADEYEQAYGIVQAAGIRIVADTNSVGNGNRGQSHNKFVVVDGEQVWTGSYNTTPQAANAQNNNAVLIRSRELARAFLHEFDEQYVEGRFGDRKTSYVPHEYAVDGARVELYFSPANSTNQRFVNAIQTADASVYVAMFTFTDVPLINALRQKREQGLDVKVVTDKLGASQNLELDPDRPGVKFKVSEYLKAHDIGFKMDTSSKLMHHKFAVIDGKTSSDPLVITGSHNWTKGADTLNDENSLVIHSSGLAAAYLDEFRSRWQEAFQPPVAAARPEPVTPRVLLTAVETKKRPRFIELGNAGPTGAEGHADISRWSLVAGGKELLRFPAGVRFSGGQKVIVAEGEARIETAGASAVYVVKEIPSAADGAVLLLDRFGRQRDAVAWANGDGTLTKTASRFLKLLVAGKNWLGPDDRELTEGLFCDAARGVSLARDGFRDTNSPSDWLQR
jgi:phosphatidylserine/phosphatidylglycerophosphate/cardiolipin synthase-like enzyme